MPTSATPPTEVFACVVVAVADGGAEMNALYGLSGVEPAIAAPNAARATATRAVVIATRRSGRRLTFSAEGVT